jgi:hypothetical protein
MLLVTIASGEIAYRMILFALSPEEIANSPVLFAISFGEFAYSTILVAISPEERANRRILYAKRAVL